MSSGKKFTNQLINETSPYLLQHAHNPVNWYAWSSEALQKAKEEDKPILVSIGYSACHWCHVMERESFEDESTAQIMNKYFINIKIDREERPDLDHIYMDAVQAMSGSGGWPLNVFLTPDAKPFYGGTYFPPVRAHNRMSWKETLYAVRESFNEKRNEIESQAENLTQHIVNANSFGVSRPGQQKEESIFAQENLESIAENLLKQADKIWGGFGKAPKFPQTFSIQYLLRHYHFRKDENALQQALLSLNKIMQGGIYDHLGGGFARYSTDEKWLAPHFEKMLYDNALLVGVFSEAYQLTQDEKYATVIRETLAFTERELTAPEGGFYSALDADSEGVEGKYYVWDKKEITDLLGEDAELFSKAYNISETGNWEHANIIWLPQTIEATAAAMGIGKNLLTGKLAVCRQKLFEARQQRIRPALDDKILLGWNALMITACCKAYAAVQDLSFLTIAKRSIHFIEANFKDGNGGFYHTWKNNSARYPAFLDDYAYLIQSYLQLQEVTGHEKYLLKAKAVAEKVIADFSDEEQLFFLFTGISQQDVIVRKKEVYDGAVPSGNAVMADNLVYLSVIFDKTGWRNRGEAMLQSLDKIIIRYPSSFGVWAMLAQKLVNGVKEVVVTGVNAGSLVAGINKLYIPSKILQSAKVETQHFPLLKDKFSVQTEGLIYLCSDYVCLAPVKSIADFILLLKN